MTTTATKTKASAPSAPRGGRGVLRCAAYVALLAVAVPPAAIPLFFSFTAGGWVHKYTSPGGFREADIPDLGGQVALVTGANTGIGFETARALAQRGAEVYITARTRNKADATVRAIEAAVNGSAKVHALVVDLASLASVEACAEAFAALRRPLHVLVLNAGVMKSPGESFVGRSMTYGYEATADGFEAHIGINHVGHWLLAARLGALLEASAPARVVVVSSIASMNAPAEGIRFDAWEGRAPDYEDGRAYGQSKLANILFARELDARYAARGVAVRAVSCHPGIIQTELGRYMTAHMEEEARANGPVAEALGAFFGFLFSLAQFTQADGALTQLQLATAPMDDLVAGGYYEPIGRLVSPPPHAQATNGTLQRELWVRTEAAVRAKGFSLSE